MLSRPQSYTILTPVETKDNLGNPIKIAGWIGESHVKESIAAVPEDSNKEKVVTPKKKEKPTVDKKSSVFKVYDFESSEEESGVSGIKENRITGRASETFSGIKVVSETFSGNKVASDTFSGNKVASETFSGIKVVSETFSGNKVVNKKYLTSTSSIGNFFPAKEPYTTSLDVSLKARIEG